MALKLLDVSTFAQTTFEMGTTLQKQITFFSFKTAGV